MPEDPITIKTTFTPRQRMGEPDRVAIEEYIAPAEEVDPYREADRTIALELQDYLEKNFPAPYGWKAFSNIAQKVIGFRLPLLMPTDIWYAINLRTHPDYQCIVVRGAGELLERYRLPRDRFDLGALLEARAEHSALICPWRKVPN